MTAIEASEQLENYLQKAKIIHLPGVDLETGLYSCVMQLGSEHDPPVPLEGQVFFFSQCAEVRSYYGEQVSACLRSTSHRAELLELINYINARVFPYYEADCSSGAQTLFTPRFYLTADSGSDLTVTAIIDYRIWELYSDELFEYAANYSPRLLDKLAVPLFGLLTERTSLEGAIRYIDHYMIGES